MGQARPPSSDDFETKDPLRRREVEANENSAAAQIRSARAQTLATAVQALSALVGVFVAGAALWAVFQARDAVEVAREGVERQAEENRLSTAMDSIGAEQVPERVGGFTILRRHVETMMERAADEPVEEQRETLRLVDTSLDIFEQYLKNPIASNGNARPTVTAETPRGWGWPDVPPDVVYAANELEQMLELGDAVEGLAGEDPRDNPPPSVDLSNVQLWGQPWAGIDFRWLKALSAPGIDLRSANLETSKWGKEATLSNSYLQCANLMNAGFAGTTAEGTDFRGANLTDANFRYADLLGADFRRANLKNVDFTGSDVEGANFKGANLNGTKLSLATNVQMAHGLPVASTRLDGTYKDWTQTPTPIKCKENDWYWETVQRGSRADLLRQLDKISIPNSLVMIEERYTKRCRAVCPAFERWYEVRGSVERATESLLAQLPADGTKLESRGDDRILTMKIDDYLYSMTFGSLAGNAVAPSFVDLDISVSPLGGL